MEISAEAKKKYIERRKENLTSLEQALIEKKESILKTIGHQLKGNARTFGYVDLEPIAIELEKAGMKADWKEAERWIEQFRAWIQSRSGS